MKRPRFNWRTLDGILNQSFDMLKRGARQVRHPFHRSVLGTTGDVGSSQRTVILRDFLIPERALVCYTDARAQKVRDIRRDNRVSWLFYDSKRKIQLRIYGTATLHGDDRFADELWANAPLTSRLNYCTTDSPGIPSDGPTTGLPEYLADKALTLVKTERGRKDFMAIVGTIDVMDWVRLSVAGNRRARFDWDHGGWRSTWLVP